MSGEKALHIIAITVPNHVLAMPRHEVAEFFIAFSRFEFALKASGFGKNGRWDEAKADWTKFAQKIAKHFDKSANEELKSAVEYVMTKPPKQQYYANESLEWKPHPVPKVSDMDTLLFHVRNVRNNLFHGAKFIQRESPDPDRDPHLVRAASLILAECLRIAPELHDAFYAEP